MSEYDSILKEKKKKVPVVKVEEKTKTKKFPTFLLSLIATMLVIIISYIVYYNTILARDKIIINNLDYLKERYQNIFNNLYLNSFNNDNLEGIITLDEINNYSFIKDKDNYYLKTPTANKYINNLYTKSIHINTTNFLTNIDKNKYLKTFYLDKKIPVVEVNLILERIEIEKILGRYLDNEYEIIITSRNHAFTNEILNMKIVINDKITSDRKVITFENNTIYYKDANKDLRFNITIKNNDFNIKIYKNDTLYSVLTGTEKINTYDYLYQIIDRLYTVNLSTKQEDDKCIYEFTSNIEGTNSSMNLTLSNISEELFELVNYTDLTDQDKNVYDQEKNTLLKFINKYKDNI